MARAFLDEREHVFHSEANRLAQLHPPECRPAPAARVVQYPGAGEVQHVGNFLDARTIGLQQMDGTLDPQALEIGQR